MHAIFEDRSYETGLPVSAGESKNMNFHAHWHADVELICVCEGSIMVGINNEARILRRGDMAICSSGDIHFYDCRGIESVHRMIIFRPELIDNPGGWPRAFVFNSPFLQDQGNDDLYGTFNSAFDMILRETEQADDISPMLIRSSLLGLCGMLARTVPSQPLTADAALRRRHRHKEMQDVLSFIESNYTDSIGLGDAAAVANMSVCHFSRLFASTAGMGFKSYLNQLRINKAEELLKESTDTITDIAYQCGFGSIRSFNRVFLSLRGATPTKMRL